MKDFFFPLIFFELKFVCFALDRTQESVIIFTRNSQTVITVIAIAAIIIIQTERSDWYILTGQEVVPK